LGEAGGRPGEAGGFGMSEPYPALQISVVQFPVLHALKGRMRDDIMVYGCCAGMVRVYGFPVLPPKPSVAEMSML
jgi:hypothetical protein